MTSVGSVASIAKMIGEFSDLMTTGMKKKVRKHFREYLLGMMIPPEIRRKSISNISSLVSEYDQSTLNRTFHAVDQKTLEDNYITYLKARIGNHRIQFIGDDTLLGHPGSKVMENVGWFYDHASGNNVLAHQYVTTMLHDLDRDEFYPFLVKMYVKKDEDSSKNNGFMTKLEIMKDIFKRAMDNFNIVGKTVDSWYSSHRLLEDHYVTEMRSNRKVSLVNLGKMTRKNSDLFYTMDEILETTFLMYERDSDILKDFPLYARINAWLSNGDAVNLVLLYNPENGRKKFLASD
ncbi:MAG: transposase [Cuniculiplasma sp.]